MQFFIKGHNFAFNEISSFWRYFDQTILTENMNIEMIWYNYANE